MGWLWESSLRLEEVAEVSFLRRQGRFTITPNTWKGCWFCGNYIWVFWALDLGHGYVLPAWSMQLKHQQRAGISVYFLFCRVCLCHPLPTNNESTYELQHEIASNLACNGPTHLCDKHKEAKLKVISGVRQGRGHDYPIARINGIADYVAYCLMLCM